MASPPASRIKKRPPKSSSSKFFSLLGQDVSQHIRPKVGLLHHSKKEAASSTDGEGDDYPLHHIQSEKEAFPTAGGSGDYEEEEEEEEDFHRVARTAEGEGNEENGEHQSRSSDDGQDKAKEVHGDQLHHLRNEQQKQKIPHQRSSPAIMLSIPRHHKSLLLGKGKIGIPKPKDESYNPNYFFLRDWDYEEGESEEQGEEEETEGETEDEEEKSDEKEGGVEEGDEEQGGGGGAEKGPDHAAEAKRKRKRKRKRRKWKSKDGWVMKKVLVFMGNKKKGKKGKKGPSNPPGSDSPESHNDTEDGSKEVVKAFPMIELYHTKERDKGSDHDPELGGSVGEGERATEDKAVVFLLDLCRALHKCGAPAHRWEYNLCRASEALGIEASFAVMPSLILISLGPESARHSETYIIRSSQSLNCAKLFWTNDLIARLAGNEIDLADAIDELASINRHKSLYPRWLMLLSFGVCSGACASLFFGGGWIEIAFSFIMGFMVGLLSWLAEKIKPLGLMLPVAASLLCAFFSRIFFEFVYPLCYLPVTLAGIVWLLPGLSITISIAELATGNAISGTTRIFSAIMYTLQLGFGLVIGMNMVVWGNATAFMIRKNSLACDGISAAWKLPLFFCISITFNMLLQAHPRQWGIMMLTALVSLTITETTAYLNFFSTDTASALAAFAVGSMGNIHARITGHPAIISIIAGQLFFSRPAVLMTPPTIKQAYCCLYPEVLV